MAKEKFRVLLAEGVPGEAAESLRALYPEPDGNLDLSIVSTIPTLLATVELAAPETIFFDLSLGRPDPLEAVRRVHRTAPGIPLIVIADIEDKHLASRSISEGAIDYLLKGFMDPRTMQRVLRTAMERNTLEGLADLLRDPLTGLYNREGFTAIGTRAMEEATRSGGMLVLLCALIENFASVHEEYGSGASEELAVETTNLLRTCFRRSDHIGRLGKSQFCSLAIDAAEPSASVLRQRVESRLAIHNQSVQPWGPLLLRLRAGFWGANDTRSFGEFLDAVESELRPPEAVLKSAEALQGSRT